MKAVIVDIQGKYAAALDESGSVIRIPNANYAVGQKIELHEVPRVRMRAGRRLATAAVAAVLVLGIGTGTAYAVPYGTVSLESAPSIEYKINCFNYVLDVTAENEEAEAVLSEVGKKNLRHRPVTRAIETTVEQIRRDGYLDEEGSTLQIKTGGRRGKHNEKLQKRLEDDIMKDFAPRGQEGKPGSEEGLDHGGEPSLSGPGRHGPDGQVPGNEIPGKHAPDDHTPGDDRTGDEPPIHSI